MLDQFVSNFPRELIPIDDKMTSAYGQSGRRRDMASSTISAQNKADQMLYKELAHLNIQQEFDVRGSAAKGEGQDGASTNFAGAGASSA